jgi:hypothetical protein
LIEGRWSRSAPAPQRPSIGAATFLAPLHGSDAFPAAGVPSNSAARRRANDPAAGADHARTEGRHGHCLCVCINVHHCFVVTELAADGQRAHAVCSHVRERHRRAAVPSRRHAQMIARALGTKPRSIFDLDHKSPIVPLSNVCHEIISHVPRWHQESPHQPRPRHFGCWSAPLGAVFHRTVRFHVIPIA